MVNFKTQGFNRGVEHSDHTELDDRRKVAMFCGFFLLPTLLYLVWWNKLSLWKKISLSFSVLLCDSETISHMDNGMETTFCSEARELALSALSCLFRFYSNYYSAVHQIIKVIIQTNLGPPI